MLPLLLTCLQTHLHSLFCVRGARTASALLLAFAGAASPLAATAQCLDAAGGKRIGLVLSGGGARGTAHVGVLQVLEDLKIPIHCIAGTSLGSVVGGLYALGLSAAELKQIVASVDWNRGFIDEFPRHLLPLRRKDEVDEFLLKFELGVSGRTLNLPRGVIQGHGLHLLLKELLGGASLVRDFNQLPIPFRAVATDIVNAQAVPLAKGDLARAIQASMAIPGIYAPVDIKGLQLVDGGVTQNLPVSVVREMGADIVIAIDIGTPLSRGDQLQSVVSILDQLTNVLTDKNVTEEKAKLGPDDVYLRPDLGGHSTMDFASAVSIVETGRKAALDKTQTLSRLSVDEQTYAQYKQGLSSVPELPSNLARVELLQTSKLSSNVLVEQLKTASKDDSSFDPLVLHESLDALYSTGLYERVTYDFVADSDGETVLVNAEEKTWGPDLIRFGFSLEDDFGGNNNFNLSAGYIRKAINALGGDLRAVGQIGETPRLLVEYFQPLQALSEFYMLVRFEHQQYSQAEFAGNAQTGQFRTRRNELAFSIGKQFSNHSDLRFGSTAATGRVQRQVGDDSLPDRENFAEGALLLNYRYDTLDSNRFPSAGNRVRMLFESAQGILGADDEYDALSLDGLSAGRIGANRLVVSLALQTTTRNTLPAQKQFSRGGLLNTSGLGQDVEVGQHTGRVTGVWYRPLRSDQIAALNYPIYYGASLGLGGVFQQRDDIGARGFEFAGNVFVGADTPAGPVFLGFGLAEGEGFSALLSLGVTF